MDETTDDSPLVSEQVQLTTASAWHVLQESTGPAVVDTTGETITLVHSPDDYPMGRTDDFLAFIVHVGGKETRGTLTLHPDGTYAFYACVDLG
jgi:hypothetical protein